MTLKEKALFEIGKCLKIYENEAINFEHRANYIMGLYQSSIAPLFAEIGIQIQWIRPKKNTQGNLDSLIAFLKSQKDVFEAT